MGAPALIETAMALVETATISIRVLSIGKKQMTLAVFRQLPEERPGEGAKLWGVVRYTVSAEDEWIVWENDGHLARWPVGRIRRELDNTRMDIQEAAEWERVWLGLAELASAGETGIALDTIRDAVGSERIHSTSMADPCPQCAGFWEVSSCLRAWGPREEWLTPESYNKRRADALRHLAEYLQRRRGTTDPAVFRGYVLLAEKKARHHVDHTASVEAAIRALPQLFIAV